MGPLHKNSGKNDKWFRFWKLQGVLQIAETGAWSSIREIDHEPVQIDYIVALNRVWSDSASGKLVFYEVILGPLGLRVWWS